MNIWSSFAAEPFISILASIPWSAFAGVIIGWILAQGTEVFKYRWQKRRLKKALFEELQDVCKWLDRARLTLETGVQLLVHEALPEKVPLPIVTHVYDKHFADISPDLSSEERMAFNSVFTQVKDINAQHHKLDTLSQECLRDRTNFRVLCSTLEGAYVNTSTAFILAAYLWDNRKCFDIKGFTDEHSKQLEQKTQENLKTLISIAKTKTKDEIRKGAK